jgi:hypothetical protein
MKEALTKAEAEALAEKLGRPITWAPVHHHGTPEGAWKQAATDSDGTNQVAPKGTRT